MVDILEQTLFGHLSSSTLVDVIQAGVSDVEKANIEGNTPLHIACKTGPIGLHNCLMLKWQKFQFSKRTFPSEGKNSNYVHTEKFQVWRKRFISCFLWQRRIERVLTYKTTKAR